MCQQISAQTTFTTAHHIFVDRNLQKMTGNFIRLIESEKIESKIYLILGQRVMLDFDLARLYEVETIPRQKTCPNSGYNEKIIGLTRI